MSETLYVALDVCLQALETGADPWSVAKRFPELEGELLPLLETSRQAKMLAIAEVPETVLRRNRARVLQHASGMRASATRQTKRRRLFPFPRLAIALAFALLFFLSGTNLVRASGGALPGDNLYPLKRTWEDVRLLLVFNPESREALEGEFEQERLHEVDELLAEGRHETIAFAGVVTEQRGDRWTVSGVPVQITAESRVPAAPVTVGAAVLLQGRTNSQGFVVADFIELLGSDVILPTGVPTQIETHEGESVPGQSGSQEDDHGKEDGNHLDSLSGDAQENSGCEERHQDSDNNFGRNQDSSQEHHGENSSGYKGQNEDSKDDHSGSGGGGDEGGNEKMD